MVKKNICLSCGRKISKDLHYCPDGCSPKYVKFSAKINSPAKKADSKIRKLNKEISKRLKYL